MEHFFDAFALAQKWDIREAAATALELDRDDIQPNLVVKQAVATQFQLTLVPFQMTSQPRERMALQDSELTQQFEIRGKESSVMSSLNVRPRHGKEATTKAYGVAIATRSQHS